MSKVIVFHTFYGCQTGCCGHAVAIVDDDFVSEEPVTWVDDRKSFEFEHFDGDDFAKSEQTAKKIEFAKDLVTNELGADHVTDLDWDNCWVVGWDECEW